MCKFTTRKFVAWSLSLFVILGIFSFSGQVNAQSTYPMRNLTLDTKGKTLLLDSSAPDREGKLNEYVDGVSIKNWKVKYEHKGSNRYQCDPPVLNMSFDKTDKSGNPKELFTGVSTYGNNAQLQYQKIRLIPECDTWNDYYAGGGDIGFDGQLNVNLREYIVHKIFKTFGVPTADVVAFANVTFISTDTKYNGKTFRYMMIQRPQELDDQIPFTTQYNLKPSLYESGEGGWWQSTLDNLVGGQLTNGSQTISFDFDKETTIRYSILTDFLNVGDMGFLHNEDGGIDLTTGKMVKIPHGFDLSFSCYSNYQIPQNNTLGYQINSLPENIRPAYQADYYRIARNIFGNSSNLSQMTGFVDKFPYSDVDKSQLKEFLKIKFYQYASYFNSKEFADSLDQTYQPLSLILPFSSNEEYENHLKSFINSCIRTRIDLSGVTVSAATPTFTISDSERGRQATANFIISITTSGEALQVFKNSGAFQGRIIGAKGSSNSNTWFQTSVISGAEDYAGPYYEIAPNTTAKFNVSGTIEEAMLVNDSYYAEIYSFQPNNKVNVKNLSFKTGTINFGNLVPIVVNSPKAGDNLIIGSTTEIAWTAAPNRYTTLVLYDHNNEQFYISNPWNRVSYPDNKYFWETGKIYVFNGKNDWIIADLNPGSYRLVVQDSFSGVYGESGYLNISSLGTTTQTSIVGSEPKLSLSYDLSNKESNLISTFELSVDAGRDLFIFPNPGILFSSDKFGINVVGSLEPLTKLDIQKDSYGQSYYMMREGEKVNFRVMAVANPKIMFAGSYKATLPNLYVRYDIQGNENDSLDVTGSNTTNSVVIVGETSPYITAVIQDKEGNVVLTGLRFANTGNTVTLGDKEFSGLRAAKNGTEISFKPVGLESGEYSIFVTNTNMGREAGKSNYQVISIKKVVAQEKPTLTLSNKTKIESDFHSGDRVLPWGMELFFNWNSTNATNCIASANPKTSTWSGDKGTSGLVSVGRIDISRTYKLICNGPGGSVEKSADVLVQGKPVVTEPTPATPAPVTSPSTSIKLSEIFCNKGDWVGKNSVIGMWLKKDSTYNPDQRFLCHTDKTIYRCTKDADEAGNASYWNTFSTRIGNGAPTPNYTCDTNVGSWIKVVSQEKSSSFYATILSAFELFINLFN